MQAHAYLFGILTAGSALVAITNIPRPPSTLSHLSFIQLMVQAHLRFSAEWSWDADRRLLSQLC